MLKIHNLFKNRTRQKFTFNESNNFINKTLYFGDSVYLRIAQDDVNKENILSKISLSSPKNIAIAFSGLNSCHFYFMLTSLPKDVLKSLIKVVVPINLRSFSPQWEFHPHFQYYDEMKRLSIKGMNEDLGIFKEYSNNDYLKVIRQYYKVGNQKVSYFKEDKLKLSTINFLDSRRKLYLLHYLYEISTLKESTRFKYLKKITNLLSELSIPHEFIILPLNHEGINFCLNESATEFLNNNINYLISEIKVNGNAQVVDLHNLLDRFCFFNPLDTTEHLNELGRNMLIKKILN